MRWCHDRKFTSIAAHTPTWRDNFADAIRDDAGRDL